MRLNLQKFLEFALQRVERGTQCWGQQGLVTITVLRRTPMGLGCSIIDRFNVHHWSPKSLESNQGKVLAESTVYKG